jgi:FkbM family methyltransferase
MYEVPKRVELVAEIGMVAEAGRAFVFIDVGANVGLFSLFVASRASSDAKIIAIEPEPQNLSPLRFNVTSNPGIPIRVIPIALGDKTEHVALEVDEGDRGGTRTRTLSQDDRTDSLSVECRPLLEVLAQERIANIDALKIEVEGNEDRILVPFFTNARPTLWPNLMIIEDARDCWRTDLFSFLEERGYAITARSKLNAMLRRTAR